MRNDMGMAEREGLLGPRGPRPARRCSPSARCACSGRRTRPVWYRRFEPGWYGI